MKIFIFILLITSGLYSQGFVHMNLGRPIIEGVSDQSAISWGASFSYEWEAIGLRAGWNKGHIDGYRLNAYDLRASYEVGVVRPNAGVFYEFWNGSIKPIAGATAEIPVIGPGHWLTVDYYSVLKDQQIHVFLIGVKLLFEL